MYSKDLVQLNKIIKKKDPLNIKIKKIKRFEKKRELFKREDGYLIWDYFRSIISRKLINLDKTKKDSFLVFKTNLFKKLIYLNHLPAFFGTSRKEIIFFGHNRGSLVNGKLTDEYIDKIIKLTDKKKIKIFSESHNFFGSMYNYKFKRKYLNHLNLIIKLKSLYILNFVRTNIDFIQNRKSKFEIIFKLELEKWWIEYFKKIKPKFIFIVSLSTNLPIVRAANKLGIIVFEIQHGSPNPYKINYNFDVSPHKRLSSPTYFLVWGKYWKKIISKNYQKNIFVIGKKLDDKIPIYKNDNDGILILDQVQFRKELSYKAIEISKSFNKNILYRFHPNINHKTEVIKKLRENNIKISKPKSNNMANDLKNIKFVIGAASTGLLELSLRKYKVLIYPTEEFYYKNFLSKKKYFGLYMLNSSIIKKKKLFEKEKINKLSRLFKIK